LTKESIHWCAFERLAAAGGKARRRLSVAPIAGSCNCRSVRDARRRRELGAVDDVAAIDRQLLAVALLDRGGARLGELAGNAADLHHRRRGRIGEHHRHLQEQAEEIADVVGAMLGKLSAQSPP
jgi:hypothetical protein